MTYHLRRKETVKAGIVRIAGSQISTAIEEIDDTELDRHEVVHQIRKRCKKLRGLIRLIRPAFPEYRKENVFFRDAAAELSEIRDAQSIIDSFDTLIKYNENKAAVPFEAVRRNLVERRREIAENTSSLEAGLKNFRSRMVQARERIMTWKITEEGFDAVADGFMKTYKRGRKAFTKAYEVPSAENFHEWRKRVKYHWYHCRLLRQIWPEMLKVHRQTADCLADLLGDDHDLAVLKEILKRDSRHLVTSEKLDHIFTLIDERRLELQFQAKFPGERLYAEKKKHLSKRFGSYWMSWRR
ncbi:MAG: CHAD domain-containing protein [Desulfopila sp.]|jgi:CHAD domain-containing protein|nr:CHAD domain-containing protein [Desulfopila sp.]